MPKLTKAHAWWVAAAIVTVATFQNCTAGFQGASDEASFASLKGAHMQVAEMTGGDGGSGDGGGDGGSGGTGSGDGGGDYSGAYSFCAREGEHCSFSGNRIVRYGANGVYVTRILTNGTDCSNDVFGDPLAGVQKSCEVMGASVASTGSYSFCANEGGRCNFAGSRTVRYGANGIFVTKKLANGVDCSNDVFGDPIVGVVKTCELLAVTDPPQPVPTSGPSHLLTGMKFHLKSANGYYVSAINGGGSSLVVDRPWADSWETFVAQPLGWQGAAQVSVTPSLQVGIQTLNRSYVSIVCGGGSDPNNAGCGEVNTQAQASRWETFRIEKVPGSAAAAGSPELIANGDLVNLRSFNGQNCSATDAGGPGSRLICVYPWVGTWETFRIEW